MTANSTLTENEMAEAAVAWLRDRLPESWEVGPTSRAEFQATPDGRIDAAIDLKGPNGTYTTMVVEVKRAFGPRDVDRLLGGVARTLRTLAGHIPILVVAPWLSQRTQELLSDQGLNYLDLTGNALIRLDNPTLYIQTQGAKKDPSPIQRSKARVQGPKAGRLIRLLVDVRPPYGVRDLAAAADLTPSYVSRLLDTLDDEALIKRSERGKVESADIAGLLRRWAETYDVFRSNKAQRYLAPAGAGSAILQLDALNVPVAVTGSFGAGRLAPVAAPALLAVYTDEPDVVVEARGLIPADQGANVALLTPFDPVVWDRSVSAGGTSYVAPSQAAVDCLTGNGRMPAEGEALIQWMLDNEKLWRLDKLPTRRTDG
jgi:DNA-binding transcriptional ArsR family regulator